MSTWERCHCEGDTVYSLGISIVMEGDTMRCGRPPEIIREGDYVLLCFSPAVRWVCKNT